MLNHVNQGHFYGAILNLCGRVAPKLESDATLPPGILIETSEANRSMLKQVYDDCLQHGLEHPRHGVEQTAKVIHALQQEVQHKINQGVYSLEVGKSRELGAILIDPPTQMLFALSQLLDALGVCALVHFRDPKTGDAYMLARHAALVLRAFQNGHQMLESTQRDLSIAPGLFRNEFMRRVQGRLYKVSTHPHLIVEVGLGASDATRSDNLALVASVCDTLGMHQWQSAETKTLPPQTLAA